MSKKIRLHEEEAAVNPKTTEYIKQIRTQIAAAFDQHNKAVESLLGRLMSKMNTLTGTMAGKDIQIDQLRSQGGDLNKTIGDTAVRVMNLQTALDNLMKHGRDEDHQTIIRLRGEVNQIGEELKVKKQEVDELVQMLGDDTDVKNGEDLMQAYTELQKFADEAAEKYENLRQEYKSLKDKYTGLHGAASQFLSAPKQPATDTAHTQHYGGFNLKEHLERAHKKQKDKKLKDKKL